MKKAQTQVTRRAESLSQDVDARVQSARHAAFKAAREGQAELAERLHLEAWNLLPEPRHQWDSSLVVALELVEFFFKVRRFDQALVWMDAADLAAEGSQNSQNLVWFGKIKFEQGQLDEAYQAFDEVFKTWRERPFRHEDPKYLDFYKSRKKSRK